MTQPLLKIKNKKHLTSHSQPSLKQKLPRFIPNKCI